MNLQCWRPFVFRGRRQGGRPACGRGVGCHPATRDRRSRLPAFLMQIPPITNFREGRRGRRGREGRERVEEGIVGIPQCR